MLAGVCCPNPCTLRYLATHGERSAWFPVQGGQRYWDGESWTDHLAPAAVPVVVVGDQFRTNHVLHLLLTVLTFGAWGVVWAFVAWQNASRRAAVR